MFANVDPTKVALIAAGGAAGYIGVPKLMDVLSSVITPATTPEYTSLFPGVIDAGLGVAGMYMVDNPMVKDFSTGVLGAGGVFLGQYIYSKFLTK